LEERCAEGGEAKALDDEGTKVGCTAIRNICSEAVVTSVTTTSRPINSPQHEEKVYDRVEKTLAHLGPLKLALVDTGSVSTFAADAHKSFATGEPFRSIGRVGDHDNHED
jgi:hypothetical protein